ncbi:hypothetical protein J4404_01300 [Candidatus Woesearchaeota archaeon]|nr:hypothetical protein [Candidatus Woesearchaeota archaeon]
MKRYSKKELLQIIQNYSRDLKRTPMMRDITHNKNFPSINRFLKSFGTWNNLLKKAGLEINYINKYSEVELIRILKQVFKQLGRTPKIQDFLENKNLPSPKTYFIHFKKWNNALKIAGLKVNVRKDFTERELLDLLRKKAKKLRRSPKMDDMNSDKNMPSAATYQAYFGSFNKALTVAGLKIKYQFRKWNKEEIIFHLRQKYDELGEPPGIRDFDKDPKTPSKGIVRKLYGNWTNALREADIPVKRFKSKEELITLLRKLAKQFNRIPTIVDLRNNKDIHSTVPFVKHFGNYTKACLMAGLVPNDGRNNNIWKAWQKHCEDMARVLYREIKVQEKEIIKGIPDIYIPNEKLFIDAKTCGYKDFKDQIKKYAIKKHRIEFWLVFKGIETKSKRVKYIYAEELAKKMKGLGEEDLAAKCYQFIKNVYSDDQTTFISRI